MFHANIFEVWGYENYTSPNFARCSSISDSLTWEIWSAVRARLASDKLWAHALGGPEGEKKAEGHMRYCRPVLKSKQNEN